MKRIKSAGLILSPFFILVATGVLWVYLIKPQLLQFALSQIPRLNQAQNIVEISVDELDFSLFQLQAKANHLKIGFKSLPSQTSPLLIEQVRVKIDPFQLLVGQLNFSQVIIDQPHWNGSDLELPEEKDTKENIPLSRIFDTLNEIPIDQVILLSPVINYDDSQKNIHLKLTGQQLQVSNRRNQLASFAKNIQIEHQYPHQNPVQAVLNYEMSWNYIKPTSQILIKQLSLNSLNSFFKISGEIQDFKSLHSWPKNHLKVESEIHFDDAKTIGLSLFPQKTRLPNVTGFIQTQGEFNASSLENINGHATIQTTQVNFDHFKLGQAQIQLQVKKSQILIQQIELQHPAGLATLKQIEIEQKNPYRFHTNLDIQDFDLQKLFISIGLTDIPVGLKAQSHIQCSGVLKPDFSAECSTESQLTEIWVKPELKDPFSIVRLKKASLQGQAQFTKTQMVYDTQVQVGESKGHSSGEVQFKEGYKLEFETPRLSFNDVESLAGMTFKGDLKMKGQSWGDTSHGLVKSQVEFTQAEIDGFKLGDLDTQLSYEKAQLSLKNVDGILGDTEYDGDILFDFKKSYLQGSMNLPVLHGEDVITALQVPLKIPFQMTGEGYGHARFEGPFQFWKLKYNLTSHLRQGHIAEENFDTLKMDLSANGEQIHFDQVFLKKPKSKIIFDGVIDTTKSEPQLKLKTRAQPLYLDDITHLNQIGTNLSGSTWIEGQVLGPIQFPELSVNFNAQQINYDGNDYPGSQGEIQINRKNMLLKAQLLGRQIQIDTLWPWDDNSNYNFRLQLRDLNPLLFLPLISLPQPVTEYNSRLNAEVDLKGPTKSLKQSNGFIHVEDFSLQRNALYLKLQKPTTMTFKNGLKQIDPFLLKGEGNTLTIQSHPNHNNQVQLTASAELQFKLFQFLVPFSQSLNGRLQAESEVVLRDNSFELLGEGNILDTAIALKGFPQPVENINTPLEFSKSKIILSDLTAHVGSSELSGSGQIDIRGPKNIQVNLQAETDHIELMFPEQISTIGRANLTFFGNWLPYTLKVDYKVLRGLVEKDFGQEEAQSKSVLKSSPYLPPQQIAQQTPSLLLDASIDLTQGVVVKNRLVEGEASGLLHVGGTPENPTMTGKIDIKTGSKLYFKDKPFDVQTATIQFLPASEITPDLYITANSRVSDYDITLLVQGIPSKNMSIKPTSQPPLSEADIFSLLALGLTSSKMDQNLSSETQQKQTGLEVLAAISNQSQINKKFQEKFGLTVQLAPSVDSTKNIAVPKVVVSKKLQKNINASYSRPLGSESQAQEWKLQYLFNPNKSVILNYQNKDTTQQEQIRNSNTNDTGILGLDFEYKKEFK